MVTFGECNGSISFKVDNRDFNLYSVTADSGRQNLSFMLHTFSVSGVSHSVLNIFAFLRITSITLGLKTPTHTKKFDNIEIIPMQKFFQLLNP